jgi:ABC-type spermidine/putrescine transport system permease subunit II
MKNKKNSETTLMLLFLSPFLLHSLAMYINRRMFANFYEMNTLPISTFDDIRFYVETGINFFFALLVVYLGLLYYIVRKQKIDKDS